MTNVAWKNLVRERMPLAISVGGVAFAVLLILILRGLYAGGVVRGKELFFCSEICLEGFDARDPNGGCQCCCPFCTSPCGVCSGCSPLPGA